MQGSSGQCNVDIVGSNGSDQPASTVEMNREYWKYSEFFLEQGVGVWGPIPKCIRKGKGRKRKQFPPRQCDNITPPAKHIPKRLNFPLKMY